MVKRKLQKQPYIEIKKEFENIVSELAYADVYILKAEENYTDLVEINEKMYYGGRRGLEND